MNSPADLFDAAAERIAYASGRPKSQERCEIVADAGLTDDASTAYNQTTLFATGENNA